MCCLAHFRNVAQIGQVHYFLFFIPKVWDGSLSHFSSCFLLYISEVVCIHVGHLLLVDLVRKLICVEKKKKRSTTAKWIFMKFGTGKFKEHLNLSNFDYNRKEMTDILHEDLPAFLLASRA
jgi:hypothetical protein